MAKRQTDTKIWTTQRWFKKLHPNDKLVWKYLTDMCDHAGIWKVDVGQLGEDTGIEYFDLKSFIACCNQDFDKENGEKISRERIKLVNKNTVWLTGFIRFQYETKDFVINPEVPAINSALTILNGYGILQEGLDKGYYTLSKPYTKGTRRTIDRDIDKNRDRELEGKLGEEKGGMGEGDEERKGGQTGIAPEMVRAFKIAFPEYPEEQSKDFGACLEIAYKIGKSKNWSKESVVNGKQPEVLSIWLKMIGFIKSDKWYSTRSISDLNNEFQRLIQSMKNGTTVRGNNQTNPPVPGIVTETGTRGF